MYALFKSIIFSFPPERAHHITFALLKFLRKTGLLKLFASTSHEPYEMLGLSFKNRVGIAAGLDKNAEYLQELAALGFGHVEIGTVTPKAQPGNELPRLFRLKDDRALINRMGFNNHGVDYAVERLKNRPKNIIIGGNIGKNKVTPNEEALNDYLICHRALFPHVDYFTINVSSPNTPGLRELQDKKPLSELLGALQNQKQELGVSKPHLLKVAPDLSDGQIRDIADLVNEGLVEGLIVSNTTIDRSGLKCSPDELERIGNGGLSGRPVLEKSNEVLSKFRALIPEKPIIGVGGIEDFESARSKFKAGANLIQVYTGFVYSGPKIVKNLSGAWKN